MELTEQIEAFTNDLNALVGRYVEEFDLPAETLVGVLSFCKNDILNGATIEFDSGFDIDDIDEDTEKGLDFT
jgi:hypothetical protein